MLGTRLVLLEPRLDQRRCSPGFAWEIVLPARHIRHSGWRLYPQVTIALERYHEGAVPSHACKLHEITNESNLASAFRMLARTTRPVWELLECRMRFQN